MSRKKKDPPSGPNMGYLISFGDTMTALLAFFIVLVSLAKDQTGANLYAGSGSFNKAIRGYGLPGQFAGDLSQRAFEATETSPLYSVDDENNPNKDSFGSGPDEEGNRIRTIDRETEDFQRFLYEFEHSFEVSPLTQTTHNMVFDVFDKLVQPGDLLPKGAQTIMADTMPFAADDRYRIEIIVWAPTPSHSALRRVTLQAASICESAVKKFNLNAQQKSRVTSAGQPWLFSDAKRPVISIVVSKQ